MQINFIAAVVASFTGLILGFVWYSVLFAKPWQMLAGATDVQVKKGIPKRALASYILTLIMALNLAAFIGTDKSPSFGFFAGLAAGLGWVAMAFGSNYLFEHRPLKLYLINAGYNILLLSLMGLIIGLM